MNKHNQDGSVNVLLLPLILASVFFVGALGFGVWAFTERQDYKNNYDEKAAVAVAEAKKQEGALKDKQYAEAAKLPLKTYNGPQQFGSIAVQYPKTWSAYVVGAAGGAEDFAAYFHPDAVPQVDEESSSFALQIEVVSETYDSVLSEFQDAEGVSVTPYSLPKLAKVVGVRVDGQIEENKRGSMIVLPLRDKTIKIYTEAESFLSDFNNNILPNLTFSP
ncbi:MAG TPA: hypothetical protein VGE30_02605 [Candidatus Saccharimonadales bacterium]